MKENKIIFSILCVCLLCSCKSTIEVPLAITEIPFFTEEELIKSGWAAKEGGFRFSFIRKKVSRAKYFKQINALNREALTLYKSGKIPTADYNGICLISEIMTDFLWYFTALGSQDVDNVKLESLIKMDKATLDDLKKMVLSSAASVRAIDKMATNAKSTNDDNFEANATVLIDLLNELLQPYR